MSVEEVLEAKLGVVVSRMQRRGTLLSLPPDSIRMCSQLRFAHTTATASTLDEGRRLMAHPKHQWAGIIEVFWDRREVLQMFSSSLVLGLATQIVASIGVLIDRIVKPNERTTW